MSHAPLPFEVLSPCWIQSENGELVARVTAPDEDARWATMRFIVRACNSHDDLLAALEGVVPRCGCEAIGVWRWSDEDGEEWLCDEHKEDNFYAHASGLDDTAVAARDAIARAKLPT